MTAAKRSANSATNATSADHTPHETACCHLLPRSALRTLRTHKHHVGENSAVREWSAVKVEAKQSRGYDSAAHQNTMGPVARANAPSSNGSGPFSAAEHTQTTTVERKAISSRMGAKAVRLRSQPNNEVESNKSSDSEGTKRTSSSCRWQANCAR